MSRRRLILAAVVLAFLAGWWYWPVGLSQEEQQIIGSWRYCCPPNGFWPNGATYVYDYLPDRTYRCQAIDGRTGSALNPIHGRWHIQDGNLAVTWDGGLIDNIRRALPAGCPGACHGIATWSRLIGYRPTNCSYATSAANRAA